MMVEGGARPGFDEGGVTTVVDFKTDHELASGESRLSRPGPAVCDGRRSSHVPSRHRRALKGLSAQGLRRASLARFDLAARFSTSGAFPWPPSRVGGPASSPVCRLLDKRHQARPCGLRFWTWVRCSRASITRTPSVSSGSPTN